MSSIRLLTDLKITHEQRHVAELAYFYSLRKLGLTHRHDPICEMVCQKIIETTTRGVGNPVAIGEIVCRELGTGA